MQIGILTSSEGSQLPAAQDVAIATWKQGTMPGHMSGINPHQRGNDLVGPVTVASVMRALHRIQARPSHWRQRALARLTRWGRVQRVGQDV